MFKKLIIAAGLLAGASAPAWSQAGQFPSGWVHGNAGASAGQGSPSSITSLLDRAFSSTRGSILERGSSGWAAIGPGATAGLPWVSNAAGADPAYQLLGAVGGGTNNAFFQVSGPASSIKTYTFPNASSTMAALATVQTWTGAQSFTDGDLILLGASSGSSTLKAPATGGGTATLFPGADTIMGVAATQSPTNKTISGSTNVLGGVTMTLGSDATGDIYYRSAGGILTRLPVGSGTQVLGVSGGLPAWTTAGAGNVSNSGTPTANQLSLWTSSTQIQGVTATAHAIVVGGGASAPNYVGPGTVGQFDAAQGASADPSFVSGPWTLLAANITGTTSISDTTHFTSTYRDYEIVCTNLVPVTTATTLEFQVHSGGSFQATNYSGQTWSPNSTAIVTNSWSTFAFMTNAVSVPNTAGLGASFRMLIENPSQTVGPKAFMGQAVYATGAANHATASFGGAWESTAAVDGFQVLFSSGNISTGSCSVYGRL